MSHKPTKTEINAFKALRAVIDAWDSLPKGHYTASEIEGWLSREMAPAIRKARRASHNQLLGVMKRGSK